MAVKIRLKPMGNRNNPFYRIVAADGRNPVDGKAIEYLGTYDPATGDGRVVLKKDRYDYWVGVGAIPSSTVKSLAKRAIPYEDTIAVKEIATEEAAVDA